MAAGVGLAPTPCGLTNRRATLTPPGIGAAGRSCTCIGSFRRRMPHVFGHGSSSNWSARQDLHLRSLGPKPSALAATLRADWRTRRELHPQPSRRQRGALLIELRVRKLDCRPKLGIKIMKSPPLPSLWRTSFACDPRAARVPSEGWWEALVTLQFVASDFVLRHPIYSRAAGSLP